MGMYFLYLLITLCLVLIVFLLIKKTKYPDETKANVRYYYTSKLCREHREDINQRSKK